MAAIGNRNRSDSEHEAIGLFAREAKVVFGDKSSIQECLKEYDAVINEVVIRILSEGLANQSFNNKKSLETKVSALIDLESDDQLIDSAMNDQILDALYKLGTSYLRYSTN